MVCENRATKIGIYRCLFGDYDFIFDEKIVLDNCDYYLFTDNPELDVFPYKTILVQPHKLGASIGNRHLKVIIPKVLREYDITIYIDSNISIVADISPLVDEFYASGALIGSFAHPYVSSVPEEVQCCILKGKADEATLRQELAHYSGQCDLASLRLSDNSIILRRMPVESLDQAMVFWFDLLKKFSGRDQLSLPFVKNSCKIQDYFFDFSPRTKGNGFFIVFPHKPKFKLLKFFSIVYICLNFIKKLAFREIALFKYRNYRS